VERSDKTGTAKLFERYLPEQIPRVLQPPSYEKPLALRNRPERTARRLHYKDKRRLIAQAPFPCSINALSDITSIADKNINVK